VARATCQRTDVLDPAGGGEELTVLKEYVELIENQQFIWF
jgi:hypothetical protein